MNVISESRLLDDPIRAHAQLRAEAPALRDDRGSLGWGDFHGQVSALARALRAQGLRPGERVAILGYDRIATVVLAFAIFRARGVLVAMNPRLATPEVRFILEDSEARLLFAECGLCEDLKGPDDDATRRLSLDDESLAALRDGHSTDDPQWPADPEDLASLNYTSGTTGRPKGVMLPHRSLMAVRKALEAAGDRWIGWGPQDLSLSGIPFFHIGGIWFTVCAMLDGAATRLVTTFQARTIWRILEEEGITRTCMVPAMLGLLLGDRSAMAAKAPQLRTVVYGGSPIPEPLLREAQQRLGCGFAQIYGLTETGNTAVCLRPEDHERPGGALLRAAGRPYPGVRIEVRDAAGVLCPAGVSGEIRIHSPANMAGYWRRPDATEESLQNGWVLTGDGGHLDEEGFLFVGDRLKDMVIIAGENVFPAEIESVLVEHEAVAEAGAIGVADARWGEVVHAFVVLVSGKSVRKAELLRHMKARIAEFKIPRSLSYVDELPRTASGKIQKHRLRERFAAAGDPSKPSAPS